MINLIGQAPVSMKYVHDKWESFIMWALLLTEFELDIETNMTDHWCTKKLITIQFGYKGHAWVLQWSELSTIQKMWIKEYLEDRSRVKLIHHAQFEYIVLRFHGIIIDNVWDTMVAEKELTGGIDNGDYALSDLTLKYLGYTLDKSEQTTFGDDVLTENKVVYAAKDVQVLDLIRAKQQPEIERCGFRRLTELEMNVTLALAAMTWKGMELNQDAWKANVEWAEPFVQDSLRELNKWLIKDEKLYKRAKEKEFVSDVDRVTWNMNSVQQKLELIQMLHPTIDGATMATMKRFVRDNSRDLSSEAISMFIDLQAKNFDSLTTILIRDHRQTLIEKGYLIPAGTITINWNSTTQALALLQAVHPRLQNLNEQSLEGTTHPVFEQLSLYKDNLKLISSYGLAFIEKFVEPDGKVRTSYNQIVSTGRLSSAKPNMQNIPVRGAIGTRYRNAFVCGPNQSYVDSDYVGAELMIITFISKDPVWEKAIAAGHDLHSVCAELVLGKEWLEAADKDCAYYYSYVDKDGKLWNAGSKQKCSCKKHKSMREKFKNINFGLCYGMGPHKLSGKVKITLPEAEQLINKYFAAFPKIGAVLKYLQNFGIKEGYSRTLPPFFRKRWYPYWEFNKRFINDHISGRDYNATLGEIGRASGNHPEQKLWGV